MMKTIQNSQIHTRTRDIHTLLYPLSDFRREKRACQLLDSSARWLGNAQKIQARYRGMLVCLTIMASSLLPTETPNTNAEKVPLQAQAN